MQWSRFPDLMATGEEPHYPWESLRESNWTNILGLNKAETGLGVILGARLRLLLGENWNEAEHDLFPNLNLPSQFPLQHKHTHLPDWLSFALEGLFLGRGQMEYLSYSVAGTFILLRLLCHFVGWNYFLEKSNCLNICTDSDFEGFWSWLQDLADCNPKSSPTPSTLCLWLGTEMLFSSIRSQQEAQEKKITYKLTTDNQNETVGF